ncbi:hypothetical protein ACOSQ4_010204 [Xanthoceras sorbifolium]
MLLVTGLGFCSILPNSVKLVGNRAYNNVATLRKAISVKVISLSWQKCNTDKILLLYSSFCSDCVYVNDLCSIHLLTIVSFLLFVLIFLMFYGFGDLFTWLKPTICNLKL